MNFAVPKSVARSASVSNGMSVDEAWREWFTPPPRSPEGLREQRFLSTADQFTINFGDLPLSAYAWGSGPTILLIHGWGSRASYFSSFVQPLVEAGFRAVAVDAPAHGRSAGDLSNLFQFSEVIETVAQRVAPVRAIIAHSMGAASATMALSRGVVVERIVLLCPICKLREALGRFVARRNLGDAVEDELVARMDELFGPRVWLDSALDEIAPQLDTPALLFHDRGDTQIPYADSVKTARAWTGSRLITTTGLGHRSLLRDPTLIEQAVEFVAASANNLS
jgi:pimeloyl-ACP methyl ester carboxylesterase